MKKKITKSPTVINELLCFALYATSRTMSHLYRHHLKDLDISYPQLLVLVLLWERDHRTVFEFCTHLHLDTGTITPLLKRLQAKKLVERRRSQEDERSVIVSLTENGRKLQSKLAELPGNMLCDLEMDADQVASLAKKIHHIRETIERNLEAKQRTNAS